MDSKQLTSVGIGLGVLGVLAYIFWPTPASASAAVSPSSITSTDLSSITGLQKALIALGYNIGNADGVYGPKSKAAVQSFQSTNGLTADAVVGPDTKAALVKALNAKGVNVVGDMGATIRGTLVRPY